MKRFVIVYQTAADRALCEAPVVKSPTLLGVDRKSRESVKRVLKNGGQTSQPHAASLLG